MTTNFAEVYNAVLHGARAQPLVDIIEFFLYRTMKYFLERANAAHAAMQDPQTKKKQRKRGNVEPKGLAG
jgi:hypothetical protein